VHSNIGIARVLLFRAAPAVLPPHSSTAEGGDLPSSSRRSRESIGMKRRQGRRPPRRHHRRRRLQPRPRPRRRRPLPPASAPGSARPRSVNRVFVFCLCISKCRAREKKKKQKGESSHTDVSPPSPSFTPFSTPSPPPSSSPPLPRRLQPAALAPAHRLLPRARGPVLLAHRPRESPLEEHRRPAAARRAAVARRRAADCELRRDGLHYPGEGFFFRERFRFFFSLLSNGYLERRKGALTEKVLFLPLKKMK